LREGPGIWMELARWMQRRRRRQQPWLYNIKRTHTHGQVDDESRLTYFRNWIRDPCAITRLIILIFPRWISTGLADWALYRPQVIWCIINNMSCVCVHKKSIVGSHRPFYPTQFRGLISFHSHNALSLLGCYSAASHPLASIAIDQREKERKRKSTKLENVIQFK
jgi:hypothetical protein